jgi:hypothetical protein
MPMVPGVIYPNSSPRDFRQVGGQSRSPVGWQNRYLEDTVRAVVGFGNMNGALDLQIHILEFP